MKTIDILNQKTTLIMGAVGYNKQRNVSIYNVLYHLSPMWKDKILEARNILVTKGEADYKAYKMNFPVWFPSGCIAFKDSKDENMVSHSNIIALDIDVKDIPGKEENNKIDITEIRNYLFNEPYVIASLQSISGKGIYVLILVEDWRKTKSYYQYLAGILKRKYNVDIDTNATNLARKRFISWEPDFEKWIKPMETEIKPWNLYFIEEEHSSTSESTYKPMFRQDKLFNEDMVVERTRQAIWALLNSGFTTPSYTKWFRFGCDFAAFKDGEEMFRKFTDNYTGNQNDKDYKNTWNNCKKNSSTINDNLHRWWQGLAKKELGAEWWKKNKQ